MRVFGLAVVGGGPSCTYVLERLAATAHHAVAPYALDVHLFEKTGAFGCGAVHSAVQPFTSYLNRIAGQVGFAADESVAGAGPLLPRELRPTLYEWCRERFAETGDPAFDLTPESWPKRRVHGIALQAAFRTYVSLLGSHPSVCVHLHRAEVTAVRDDADGFTVHAAGIDATTLHVNEVLFVTGHSSNDPLCVEALRPRLELARDSGAVYVPYAYPLEERISDAVVAPGRVVGIDGMGLTAIDVILHLTEGRGGRFASDPISGRLQYCPSGAEPAVVVPFGHAGLFTFARPYNAKQTEPSRLEHRPVFLTEAAIDRLRASVGTPMEVSPIGLRLQLAYERDVHPLVLLEMACLYYRTLLGADFGDYLEGVARPSYESFLDGVAGACTPEEAAALLLTPVDAVAREALGEVGRGLDGNPCDAAEHESSISGWSREAAVRRYRLVVFGDGRTSRRDGCSHGHATSPRENVFSWDRLIHPIPAEHCTSPRRYRDAVLAFMDRDHRCAAQDNVTNPEKAAADGVWRDLRQVLAYAIDFGGLTARSHREFLAVYMRHHNRLANGAALEVMEKIRALAECGLLDVSVGPQATVDLDRTRRCFVVRGPITGAMRPVDIIIDAKVHAFDPETDSSPLYGNMLRAGLVRKWRNPSSDGADFLPGGLDLDADCHPIRGDGRSEPRLTFLGPPSEGVMFFQLGALRPWQNHHVMRDIVRWVQHFWTEVATFCAASAGSPVEPGAESPPVVD